MAPSPPAISAPPPAASPAGPSRRGTYGDNHDAAVCGSRSCATVGGSRGHSTVSGSRDCVGKPSSRLGAPCVAGLLRPNTPLPRPVARQRPPLMCPPPQHPPTGCGPPRAKFGNGGGGGAARGGVSSFPQPNRTRERDFGPLSLRSSPHPLWHNSSKNSSGSCSWSFAKGTLNDHPTTQYIIGVLF